MSKLVLLVDSSDAYRAAISGRLVEKGFEVRNADCVQAARAQLLRGGFQLVITDNLFSDGTGSDLTRGLIDQNIKVKTLLISAPTLELSAPDDFCRENGITRLVYGPLAPEKVVQLARELMDAPSDLEPRADIPMEPVPDDARETFPGMKPRDDLKEIRDDYGRDLPLEFKKLEQSINKAQQLVEGPEFEELIEEVRRSTHTIYGTAGTLGFHQTAEVARKISEMVRHIGKDSKNLDAIFATMMQHVTQVQSLSERPSAPPCAIESSSLATIMIVDFNPDAAFSYKDLGKDGLVRSITVYSKEDALAKAADSKLHGVLIDLDISNSDMPFELAHTLREIDGYEDLGIAFMSSDSSVKNRVAAASAGATIFLHKPVDGQEYGEMARTLYMARQKKAPRILLVDDDGNFRSHISATLTAENMDVRELENPNDVLEALETFTPDLMLLDVEMPKISGWDVCKMVRSVPVWQHLPILFLTAKSTPEARIKCFKSGGDDYIQKPCFKEELIARIGLRLERIRLFNERADRDLLTTLLNRRAFLTQLKLRMADSARQSKALSLCILDLDNFKHVNDTYGHLAGDRVLTAMGKILSARFREVDIRCRWGGEEFAIAFFDEDPRTSRMILSRVLNSFRNIQFQGDNGELFHVTFSAGIACFPQDGKSFEALFKKADRCLYKAKKIGRNCILST